ncbi:MAG: hypothetical protein J6J74_08380, partial [Elusimicrobiaceae bacterium]|nr:hypothetical protein [Elusimicrobiaceae bacterium]
MKQKWLAGCLVCLLLLCGCRAVEPITSASNGAKSTTATSQTTTVTKVLTTTRPSNYTYDVGRTQATGEFTLMFADFEEYAAKLKTFTDKQTIYANGNELTAKDPAVQETNFSVLLKEKYFLVPCIAQPYRYGSLMFHSQGYTMFLAASDIHKDAQLTFLMYHGTNITLQNHNKPKQYSFTNERGVEIVRYGKE